MAPKVSPDSPPASMLFFLLFKAEKSTQENPATSISTPAGIGARAPYAVVLDESVTAYKCRELLLTHEWHPELIAL